MRTPSSSSTTKITGWGWTGDESTDRSNQLDRRKLQECDEQPESPHRLRELIIIHRLLDVNIAAELVTALDLARIIRGGQHDHRQLVQLGIRLQATQHLDSVHFGHANVEQHQITTRTNGARCARIEEEIECGLAVAKMQELVGQPGILQALPHEDCVTLVILNDYDDGGIAHGGASRLPTIG